MKPRVGRGQAAQDRPGASLREASWRPMCARAAACPWVSSAECRQTCRFGSSVRERAPPEIARCREIIGGGDRSRTGDGGFADVR